jgi:Abnormal spindle-like microcephaly-assoc'd, ASPM-SPD-2-Hydin
VLKITNSSPADVLIGNVSEPAPPFTIFSGAGQFSLAPGQSTTVTLQFAPTILGVFSSGVVVSSNDARHPSITVAVTGSGVPSRLVVPRRLPFPRISVGSSVTMALLIKNPGLGVLHANVTGPSGPFSLVSGSGEFALSRGESDSVTLRFSPVTPGAFTGMLTITSDDPSHATSNVTLVGIGK